MSVRKNQNFLKMSLVLFFLGIIEQFEHMDLGPGTQINADRYGSGSVTLLWTCLYSRIGLGQGCEILLKSFILVQNISTTLNALSREEIL